VSAEAELGRRLRLGQLADEGGVFAIAAADHRDALRTAYVRAGLEPPSDEGIRDLKTLIVRELAPHVTGLLLDFEWGAAALAHGALGPCPVVLPLEAQGYGDAASGRRTTLIEGWSPARALVLGATACKLLLPYRADDPDGAAAQDAVVRTAVAACHEAGLPLVLEPIVHALPDDDERAYTEAYPAHVLAGVERLQPLGPDILKVQFPRAEQGDEAAWCDRIDAACGPTPWVLLGGGTDAEVFARDLAVACDAGASGFIAGRTVWQSVIGTHDGAAARSLRATAVPLLERLRDIACARARPFTDRLPDVATPALDWYR
jgi:tagatose-1,6-bisphosphate aldolase